MNRLKASKYIASTFFVIGSLLFITQIFWQELTVVTIIGYYYLAVSIIINTIIVIILLFVLLLMENKRKTLMSIGIILLNIPVAFIYTIIVVNHLI